MAKNITSFDVARRAGVSQPTVSRVLRNLPGASSATRDRVLAAAQALAYVPSDTGRVLATQRTRRVAVVSEALTNPFYPALVEPIGRYLEQHGLRGVVVTHAEGDGVALEVLADGSYDGAVLTTTSRRSTLPRDLAAHGVPFVLANRLLDVPIAPSCAADNAAGGRAVATLLADLGHRVIASVQGPVETSTGKERGDALRRRLRELGLHLPRSHVRRAAFSHEAGFEAATDLLRYDDRPTAIVCGNDVLALGVLSAARRSGLRIPADLTVIGFDDIPMACWPLADLTTVRCDLDALAASAVELLDGELSSRARPPAVRRIPVQLVLRGTHARPSR